MTLFDWNQPFTNTEIDLKKKSKEKKKKKLETAYFSKEKYDPYALSQFAHSNISSIFFFFFLFFIYTFTQLKQKNTITSSVNINVPGIQLKKGLNKEQIMVIRENIC